MNVSKFCSIMTAANEIIITIETWAFDEETLPIPGRSIANESRSFAFLIRGRSEGKASSFSISFAILSRVCVLVGEAVWVF